MKALKLITATFVLAMSITGCQKGNLNSNPNAINANSVIPVSLIVNHLTAILIRSEEMPFGDVNKSNQFQVSNYAKYWGTNEDTWSYSAHSYEILKYAIQLEVQAKAQLGNTTNKYYAMSKFFRAYSAIWLAQRVGDIPMTQAGDINFLTPAFDTQHDVYKNSLKLLDDANTILATAGSPTTVFDSGDIFGLTNLQWQKVINSYRLRILISLSKRADDNADLNVKQQFAAIVGSAATYPIMTGNSDNLVYKFNATNLYPIFATGSNSYNNFMNVGKPVLDITTSTKDPRTYLMATPVTTTNVADFSNYLGADPGTSLATLQNEAATGKYSFFNAQRYLGNASGATAEPFIFIGYPEMAFNIAEGINRGWASTLSAADAKAWYDKGIAASFSNFGLSVTSNSTVTISDVGGKSLGTVTTDNATFLANVSYNLGSSTAALAQILQQKYVAFFMNSGWEAYFNHRRTNLPALSEGGTGLGTAGGKLPRRWLYPLDEINSNNANYQKAIASQFGGTEDVFKDTWLTK
ncbi:SusD/RagB family nutrient-binding outer membrane lipoprotein [Mucilaginibacter sp. cycad4]|uniref:SusD/RagB family nutrient-binding outer membrane lipoprotein n=1 Tax=Mucilaginibacter sp. cycad4 TaxID=3342096 RepID=UPI002AAC38F0|nr:SusD/RagB family nutrient-binding outer membrane lipoprotein [Mucilaginibacter gossypii]WPV01216.1 SusD/RagB family nutrient-binding outer membrane lipoprotein [Mucilaginibacter gossypii]